MPAKTIIADALLFDMDGTLVDSTAGVEGAWQTFAQSYPSLDVKHILSTSHGVRTVDNLRKWCAIKDEQKLKEESDRFEVEIVRSAKRDGNEGLKLLPGVAAIIDELKRYPLAPWALCTSATRVYATEALAAVGIPTPRVFITADDVTAGKPSPEPYLRGAQGLHINPKQCVWTHPSIVCRSKSIIALVFEDSPAGVLSGLAAGSPVLGLLTTHEENAMKKVKPTYLVPNLSQNFVRAIRRADMNISQPVASDVASVSFSFLTTGDIRRISVKQVVNPVLLDDLNRPNPGGLYDPALGPANRKDVCATCRLSYFSCPGHFGHIELPATVFHPLFMTNVMNLIRGTCLFCHKFKAARSVITLFEARLNLLDHGLLHAAHILEDEFGVPPLNKADEEAEDSKDRLSSKEYERAIRAFVKEQLDGASSSKRDHYKDSHVYQMRRSIIYDFLKTTLRKTCTHCGAYGYTFRKEGYTKIIEYDLPAKQKERHLAFNLKRPDVLFLERAARTPSLAENQIHEVDFDSETSEVEPRGQATASDVEEEVPTVTASLPKAANGRIKTARGRAERIITPEELRAHLRRLFRNERDACAAIYGRHGVHSRASRGGFAEASADMFFMDVIPVSPTRFRPPIQMAETIFEHQQNELLSQILKTSYRIRDFNVAFRAASQKESLLEDPLARDKVYGSLLQELVQLQNDVNGFIDSSKNSQPMRQGKVQAAGVKQGLEKKEGLFRQNMMGKRVNYAARSVISPDVNIEPNEIGMPPVFAKKLTFPEPVTPHNFHEMRQLVIAGTSEYPGASMIEFEDGRLQNLSKLTLEQRTAIANQLLTAQDNSGLSASMYLQTRSGSIGKKVYRNIRDGDYVLLNRQPTLHKPSMMAHKVRVLQGEKTIRMHYANCNSYNEMNIHFPQNHVPRAEAMFIANTDNQYLVPTSGKPLRGLIQDHVVAGVWMTSKSSFFTREVYQQLLYGSLKPEHEMLNSTRIRTLPPAIIKPVPLWTGKQIISTVLLNTTPQNARGINLESKSKVPSDLWGADSKEEGQVVFMDGELVCGILDKSQFGATDYGFVHTVYELYGAECAGKLLGILSRLFSKFLQHRAFTCRMDDLALTPKGDKERKDMFAKDSDLGHRGALENFPSLAKTSSEDQSESLRNLLEDVLRDDDKMAGLDMTVKQKLNESTKNIAKAIMSGGLLRRFPDNHMQMMTVSGAKGSAVNAQQISVALGQQELEGRRVPVMVSGKTLPSFKAFETAAIAGGYVANRFLTGIRPQEFFFHCMAGREGLIDTAVKTSRSGYLQRCLIKHLEGIRVHYDHTVRGSDSSVYQFHYGGDALDVSKQKYLNHFDFAVRNFRTLINRYHPEAAAQHIDDEEALVYMKKVLKKLNKHPEKSVEFSPALSVFSPSRYLGSTSESFAFKLAKFIKDDKNYFTTSKQESKLPSTFELPRLRSRDFRGVMNLIYMRSLVEPGESVGLLASQGIGEPSTQMTLNTFHFAGHGAANVTLGIPRLRELIMTASTKPKTPAMRMKLVVDAEAAVIGSFSKQASRLKLSQVTDQVFVRERLARTNEGGRSKFFSVDIKFYPCIEYTSEYDVTPAEILNAFAVKFPLMLKKEITLELKKLDASLKSQVQDLGKGSAPQAETGGAAALPDDNDELAGDGGREDEGEDDGTDADNTTKQRRQTEQQESYESDGERDLADELEAQYGDAAIEAMHEDDDSQMSVDADAKDLEFDVEATRDMFLSTLQRATNFDFSEDGCQFELQFEADSPKLLLVGIVERACNKSIIREIPGIDDCFQLKDDKGLKKELMTNGSNLRGMWAFAVQQPEEIISLNDLYSNDIHAVLTTYGVEMARAVILREVGSVFEVYNIDVDRRHLELIADYMTYDGGYKPFNRSGIATSSSPLLKASFETTASFISDATLFGDFDDLTSPSGNIVLGRPAFCGTGSFDVLTPLLG